MVSILSDIFEDVHILVFGITVLSDVDVWHWEFGAWLVFDCLHECIA